MPPPLNYTKYAYQQEYSEIIDVRSPGEFAEDHLPDAINLPVMDNEQRAKVGTIYQQVSPFQARKIGAAIVSENIAQHLTSHFVQKDKDYSPLVYCWRGGQRSRSLALILSEIGWHVTLLEGGYKTYRAYVRQQLETLPQKFTYKIICGLTGTGKTQILRRMAQQGFQVLDLEKLANHRGSLLGQEWDKNNQAQAASSTSFVPQPSQKLFESSLLQELQKFDFQKVVWLESESNKIGKIYLPSSLWNLMKQANCVEVKLPQNVRVEQLLETYPHLTNNPDCLKEKLQNLKNLHSQKIIEEWFELIDAGKYYTLVEELLTLHYDPSYHRSMSKSYYPRVEKSVSITDLSVGSIDMAIREIVM